MSVDKAVTFMSVVRDDSHLQAELRKLDAKDFAGLLKIADAHGFPAFSQEDYITGARIVGGEWLTWVAKLGKSTAGDLTDADLEQVAGGKSTEPYKEIAKSIVALSRFQPC